MLRTFPLQTQAHIHDLFRVEHFNNCMAIARHNCTSSAIFIFRRGQAYCLHHKYISLKQHRNDSFATCGIIDSCHHNVKCTISIQRKVIRSLKLMFNFVFAVIWDSGDRRLERSSEFGDVYWTKSMGTFSATKEIFWHTHWWSWYRLFSRYYANDIYFVLNELSYDLSEIHCTLKTLRTPRRSRWNFAHA